MIWSYVLLIQTTRKSIVDNLVDTDCIVSNCFDIESDMCEKNASPNFDLYLDLFSDISDSELLSATHDTEVMHRFHKPMQPSDLDTLAAGALMVCMRIHPSLINYDHLKEYLRSR